jgi:hypothetical protein
MRQDLFNCGLLVDDVDIKILFRNSWHNIWKDDISNTWKQSFINCADKICINQKTKHNSENKKIPTYLHMKICIKIY